MGKANRRSIGTVFTHVLLWGLLGFVFLFYPPLSWNISLPNVFWIKNIYILGSMAGIFYLNYLLFAPRWLFSDKRIFFFIWVLAIIFLEQSFVSFLNRWIHFEEAMAHFKPKNMRHQDLFDGFVLMITLLVLGISTSVAAVKQWQQDARMKEELQKQQIASELAFLKAQINPHFFFNTLNNIYALSYTDVELSREALHTLSRMMRYLLYETPQHETSLLQEIKFIKDHIELMKLRLSPNNEVSFQEPVLGQDRRIAPMLLFPFVENAFKHGISTTKPTKITIGLQLDGDHLQLKVSNTLQEANTFPLEESGIGLQNTKRRLNLLYPNKHRLVIQKDDQNMLYQIELTLTLS